MLPLPTQTDVVVSVCRLRASNTWKRQQISDIRSLLASTCFEATSANSCRCMQQQITQPHITPALPKAHIKSSEELAMSSNGAGTC